MLAHRAVRNTAEKLKETCAMIDKKAQLSLTNPRDACEKFARFT